MSGIELIAKERQEQIYKHNRSTLNDLYENSNGELIQGAIIVAGHQHIDYMPKQWDKAICEKMLGKSYKERLIIAGALIAAELDRLELEEYLEK